MGNRILKESICTSEEIDCLSPEAETMFYRLLVNCDDFGRMDARLPIVKSKLFPLKPYTEHEIGIMLNDLCWFGLTQLYVVDNRKFIQVRKWEKHQTVRNKHSKYPEPIDSSYIQPEPVSSDLKSIEINCNQLNTVESSIQSNPIRIQSNPIQSRKKVKEVEQVASLPFDSKEYKEAWDGFLEMRRKNKKVMTSRAMTLLLQKLDELAHNDERTQIAILNKSIESSWSSVYQLKEPIVEKEHLYVMED